jgi:hypothetical protein
METRQKLLAEVSNLSKEQCEQVFLGIWSVNDVLAHMIGWDVTNLDAMKSVQVGQVPAFYEHKDRDWQTYNAMLVKKHKKGSTENLLVSMKTSQDILMKFLQAVPPWGASFIVILRLSGSSVVAACTNYFFMVFL